MTGCPIGPRNLAQFTDSDAPGGVAEGDLVHQLLRGAHDDPATLWALVAHLGLSFTDPYAVVVARDVQRDDATWILQVRRRLAQQGVTSAWRSEAVVAVGVLSVPPSRNPDIVGCLTEASAVVGLSPLTRDWLEAPRRFLLAASAARAGTSTSVTTLRDAPLAVLVASTADLAHQVVMSVLGPVLAEPPAQRDRLLQAVELWFDTDGSYSRTAEVLFTHPNTVRNRINRFEQLTGKSLSRPHDLAAVAAAVIGLRLIPTSA